MPKTWEIGSTAPGVCYLEGFADDERRVWRTMVRTLPFSIGRRPDSDLVLTSGRVSHRHATIESGRRSLWLRDLGSTNGTFLNGLRLEQRSELRNGDIVHFADQEFRLVMLEMPLPGLGPATPALDTQIVTERIAPGDFFRRARALRSLLAGEEGEVVAYFQPIVPLRSDADPREPMGSELLGRARLEGAIRSPFELFELAGAIGATADLSAAFRREGLRQSPHLPADQRLFLNTHPEEIAAPGSLLSDLRSWRRRDPHRPAVLEIHEGAVADLDSFRRLCGEMRAIQVGIAFDDFGKGQARLLELADVEPDFVKFDRAWIDGLDAASSQRRRMIESLIELVDRLGIETVAEGVETEGEAAACRELGFHWAQGFLFGRPAPLDRDVDPGDDTRPF